MTVYLIKSLVSAYTSKKYVDVTGSVLLGVFTHTL